MSQLIAARDALFQAISAKTTTEQQYCMARIDITKIIETERLESHPGYSAFMLVARCVTPPNEVEEKLLDIFAALNTKLAHPKVDPHECAAFVIAKMHAIYPFVDGNIFVSVLIANVILMRFLSFISQI